MPYEKVGKNKPVCIADEVPFEIPDTWEWVRLGSIGDWGSGATPSRSIPEYYGGDIPWLKTGDLNDGYIEYIPENISRFALEKTSVRLNPAGSVLIAMYGATIGKLGILTFPATTNQACCACLPIEICNEYLFYFLMSQKVAFVKQSEGGAQPNISKKKIVATLMPLPSLAEQYRIVAKIKEVLQYIERYGEACSTVNSLNKAFPDLLKKSILQEAVQGKLVPQDPADEPASILLERIRAEKEQLIKAGKIKRDKHESVIFRRDNSHYEKLDGIERCIDDELPFEIPESWEWCRIGTLFSLQAGKNISSAAIKEIEFAGSVKCYGGNGVRGYVSEANHHGDYPIIGRQGALCGNINRATGDFYATEHAVCVDTFGGTDISWACLFLEALNLNQYATATAQPGLAVANINMVWIPLPPLNEQLRIVVKVDEAFPIIKAL